MFSVALIPTGAGIPYTVSIFAENSAGNGTVCNFTDFTNELCKFHCSSLVTELQTSQQIFFTVCISSERAKLSAWIEFPLCATL